MKYKQEFAGIVDLAAPPPPPAATAVPEEPMPSLPPPMTYDRVSEIRREEMSEISRKRDADAAPTPDPPPIVAAESWLHQAPRTPVAGARPLYLLEAQADKPSELKLSLTSKNIQTVAFLQEYWHGGVRSNPRVVTDSAWYERFMIPKSIHVVMYGIGKHYDFEEQYVKQFEEILPRLKDYEAIVVNTRHSYAIGAFVARKRLDFKIFDMMKYQKFPIKQSDIKYKQQLDGVTDNITKIDPALSVGN